MLVRISGLLVLTYSILAWGGALGKEETIAFAQARSDLGLDAIQLFPDECIHRDDFPHRHRVVADRR
jgi:hypothetical protein